MVSSQVAICGANCGINPLFLCGLDLVHRHRNPSTQYWIILLLQWGSWNFISSLPSSGATQYFRFSRNRKDFFFSFSFMEQNNSSFPDSARWGSHLQKSASRAEANKAHMDRSPGQSQRQMVLRWVSLQRLQGQRSFFHPLNPPELSLDISIQFPTLSLCK